MEKQARGSARKKIERRRIGRFGGEGWRGKRKGKENWSGAKGMKGGGRKAGEEGRARRKKTNAR